VQPLHDEMMCTINVTARIVCVRACLWVSHGCAMCVTMPVCDGVRVCMCVCVCNEVKQSQWCCTGCQHSAGAGKHNTTLEDQTES